MQLFAALRRGHLRALWSGLVLSAIGDTLYNLAVVWIAVDAAGASGGLVAATQSAATLVLAPFGGVLADRVSRRRMLIVSDLVRAAVVATLPVAAAYGPITVPHLVGVALVLGAMQALFTPALQASLPILTDGVAELRAMSALHDATMRIARAVGPSLAGLLAAAISVPHFFTLDAVSFLVSAAAITSIGSRFDERGQPAAARELGARGVFAELVGALQVVRANRPLALAFPGLILINATWSAAFTIGGALFAARELGGDVGAYGLLVGAYGAGNITSNLVIGSLGLRHRVPMLFLGNVVLGGGFLLLAIAPSLHLAMLAAALAAVGGPIESLALVAIIQDELPREQLGKIFSLRMMVQYAGVSLGLVAAGPLFTLLSVRAGIAASAALMVGYGFAGYLRFRAP